jgi:hypothetical protein
MKSRMRAGFGAVAAAVAVAAGVAQPAGGQLILDCTVSGGGRLLTASGDQATFGGSASSEGVVRGHEVYIDHGPATPIQFRSLVVTAVVCNLDARRAEIVGTGEVQTGFSTQIVQFRIAVLAVQPQSQVPDTYRITLSNGYDSGEQPVLAGNITMHRH